MQTMVFNLFETIVFFATINKDSVCIWIKPSTLKHFISSLLIFILNTIIFMENEMNLRKSFYCKIEYILLRHLQI